MSALRSWLRPTFADLLGVFLIVMLVSIGGAVLFGDSDTATHVATGRWILDNHQVPKIDPFARTRPGMPWFAHEWLADVGMALVHRGAGWQGMLAATAIVIAWANVMLYRFLVRRGDDTLAAFGAVVAAASAASSHWLARPHLLTVLCLVIGTIVLEQTVSGRRPRWWLMWIAPLSIFWANVHGGFMVIFGTLACYGVSILWEARGSAGGRARGLIAPILACSAATAIGVLINPWGWRLPAHLLNFFGRRGEALAATSEFQPPSLHDRAGVTFAIFLLLCVAALGASLWASVTRPRDPIAGSPHPGIVLAFLMSTAMSFASIRHVEVMAVFGTLVLAGGASSLLRAKLDDETRDRLESLRRYEAGHGGGLLAAALAVVVMMAGAGRLPRAGFDPAVFPVALVAELKSAGIAPSGPVFTPGIWGGYLLLELPGAEVFVDGRWDMRGDAYFRRYSTIYLAQSGWSRLLDEAGVTWALLPLDAPLVEAMTSSPDWTLWRKAAGSAAFQRKPPRTP